MLAGATEGPPPKLGQLTGLTEDRVREVQAWALMKGKGLATTLGMKKMGRKSPHAPYHQPPG